MVWFARIEEIEGQNLKDNILVMFWSPQFFFVDIFRKSMWLQEAVTDLKVAVCSPGNCLPTGIEKRKAHIG